MCDFLPNVPLIRLAALGTFPPGGRSCKQSFIFMYSLDEYTNGIQPCDKKSRQLDENTTSFINILSKNAFDARFWSDLHLTKRVKSITLVMELFHVSFSIIKIGNVSNSAAEAKY